MQTNTHFTVRPINKQLFQLNTEQSHPRLSLRRVLYVRFLRWIEKSPLRSILATCLKCLTLLLLCCVVLAPSFFLGVLTASAKWNNYRLPIMLAIVVVALNAPRCISFVWRYSARQRKSTGKALVFHGVPLDELATYLFTNQTFTTKAINDLGLAQRKWSKIADELEHNKILVRGENNARVLADIDRETLVRQLRDGFPLTYDAVSKTWVEKRGSFDQWVLSRERKEAKEQEQRDRLERKEDRMRKNIAKMREESNAFQNIMALTGA